MTTKLKMLPVRVRPALRALIDQAGPVNAATRALIILGAEAAGLDLAGMEREIAGLLAENLAPNVLERLQHTLLQSSEVPVAQTVISNKFPEVGELDTGQHLGMTDLFAQIGIEV
jgi:hypothetical protein